MLCSNSKDTRLRFIMGFMPILPMIFASSCKQNKDEKSVKIDYDSSKPVQVGLVYPDSGKFLEKALTSVFLMIYGPQRDRQRNHTHPLNSWSKMYLVKIGGVNA